MERKATLAAIALLSLLTLSSCGEGNGTARYRVIDIEHHFATKTLLDGACMANYGMPYDQMPEFFRDTQDPALALGEERLKAMDEAGVDYAHLSLMTPGAESFEPEQGKAIATEANDLLAGMIARYPDRIGGWMVLYPEDPEWSVREIERAAAMGLFGWSCLSNMNGKYLDDRKYWPIFAKLEELGMPVYLHPEFSPVREIDEFGYSMNGPTLGFTVDALTCFMRMLCRGLFDQYPNLKIILGHDGETLPFLTNRIDTAVRQYGDSIKNGISVYKHAPSHYIEHNLWITTSGNFSQEALRCSIDAMPEGRVMVSTDYPFEDFAGSISFIRDNDRLTEREKRAILGENAMRIGFGRIE